MALAASARAAMARPFQAASALPSRAGCGRVARRSEKPAPVPDQPRPDVGLGEPLELLEVRPPRPVRALQHPRRVAQHEHRLGQLFKLGFPVDVEERACSAWRDATARDPSHSVVAVELCRMEASAAAREGAPAAGWSTTDRGDRASRRFPRELNGRLPVSELGPRFIQHRHHRIAESTLVDAPSCGICSRLLCSMTTPSACVEQRPHRQGRAGVPGGSDKTRSSMRVELRQRAVEPVSAAASASSPSASRSQSMYPD